MAARSTGSRISDCRESTVRNPRSAIGSAGFTLLELLIAIFVLAVAMGGALGAVYAAGRRSAFARQRTVTADLARSALTDVRGAVGAYGVIDFSAVSAVPAGPDALGPAGYQKRQDYRVVGGALDRAYGWCWRAHSFDSALGLYSVDVWVLSDPEYFWNHYDDPDFSAQTRERTLFYLRTKLEMATARTKMAMSSSSSVKPALPMADRGLRTVDSRQSEIRSPKSAMSRGFSLIEVLVAIAVSTVLFGLCIAAYVQVNKYRRRSEKLLLLSQTARGVNARLARDFECIFVIDDDADGTLEIGDYWKPEDISGTDGTFTKLSFVCATENRSGLDYRAVSYYVSGTSLVRKEAADMAGLSGAAATVIAEGVLAMRFQSTPDPAAVVAGEVPEHLRVYLKLEDEGSRMGYQHFGVALRPRSEEK
ncbi:MAG: prepilin-type N-terminal cleavage/methylation domain-containing protein [Planctomycetota bacterium]|jgi:prepilin-type N-terminal cleavage/methylation domain-containing protein